MTSASSPAHPHGPEPNNDDITDTASANGAQTRWILGLVVVFTVAFIAVIAMRVQREWLTTENQARIAHAAAAESAAETLASRLSFVHGSVVGASSGIQTDWNRSTQSVARHLEALAARPQVHAATLIIAQTATADPVDDPLSVALAQATKVRSDNGVWSAPGPDGGPALYAAADLVLDGELFILVALLDVSEMVEPSDRFTLVDSVGNALIADRQPIVRDAAFVSRLLDERGVATRDAVEGQDGNWLLGAAPVGDVAGAYVFLAEPYQSNNPSWRRTVVFYALLLVAPILVSVGLCAVLLMQIDNVRSTKRKLMDSERRFRLAVEGARCGVWDWDLDSDTVYITASLARMLGARQAQMLSRLEFLNLVQESDREKLELAIRNASRVGQVDVEFRAAHRPCSLHARGRPWLPSGEEQSNRVVGVAIDVTEQHGARSRVIQAEGQLAAALDSINESFALWDADRRLVLSNPRFGEFFRLDNVLTRRGAVYDDFEMAATTTAIRRVLPQQEKGSTEMELVDGRWLLVSDRPTEDGGMVSIGTDITPLKQQEERLTENDRRLRHTIKELNKTKERLEDAKNQAARARTKAEEASRSKTEFLANMSHELRTPLNAIIGFSDVMKMEMFGEMGDERYKEYANDIWDSGQLLLRLIRDILDMSKIEAGKAELTYETVYPDEVAEQCARLIRERAKAAELAFAVELADMPAIEADPLAIKQILLNLLSNAVKFTKPGGAVTLKGEGDEAGVKFKIVDTGVGIAQAHIARLGRPFEQIESYHAKTHAGAGLGLALSKSLAELHGGELVIESELGVGTAVTIWIPRNPPKDVNNRPASAPREPEAPTTDAEAGVNGAADTASEAEDGGPYAAAGDTKH